MKLAEQVQAPMPAAWYGLCTDCLHNEWGHGGAVPATILELNKSIEPNFKKKDDGTLQA
jgi:hypothetical protein